MNAWPGGRFPGGWSRFSGSQPWSYTGDVGGEQAGALVASVGDYQTAELAGPYVVMPCGGELSISVMRSAPAGATMRKCVVRAVSYDALVVVGLSETGGSHAFEPVTMSLPAGEWRLEVELSMGGPGAAAAIVWVDDYTQTVNQWPPETVPAGWTTSGDQAWAPVTLATPGDALGVTLSTEGYTASIRSPSFSTDAVSNGLGLWLKPELAGRSAATLTVVAHGALTGPVVLQQPAIDPGGDGWWRPCTAYYDGSHELDYLPLDDWYIEVTLSAGPGTGTVSAVLDNFWIQALAPPPDRRARLPLRLSVVAAPPLRLPLRLSVVKAPPLRLPLRLSVGSSAPGRPLPLRLAVRAAALAGAFDGAAEWSAAPSGQWQLSVQLGAEDVSARVHGSCTVQIAVDAARTAGFAFLPIGPLAVMGLVGQRVQIAFSQRGGAGGQVLFRGVVDVPSVDLTTGLVSCECTDQAQETWAAASREAIDALVGGRWHPAVTGEPDDNFGYLKARLLSVAASWHLDVQQQPCVVQWAGPARTLTVRAADVVDGSLSIDLPSRDQLRTQVVCRMQYRYPLHRGRGITAQYNQPLSFFLPWYRPASPDTAKEGVLWLTAGMVERAAGSLPGWELSKPLTIDHPEPGSYLTTRPFLNPVPRAEALTEGAVYIISPAVASALALGFTASYVARWQQSVTEDYTVTVKWPALEQQLGTVSSEELGATLEATFDSPDWGRDLSVLPQIAASGDGDTSVPWQPAGADPAARDEVLRTLLDHAWVRLWSASRTGRVRFAVPCRPDLALSDAVVLEHDRLRASGRVVAVTHTLSMETGEALTEVAVAVGMPGNAPASPPTWSLPAPPVDGYVPPLSAYSCEIGTFVGGTVDAPPFDDATMVGFSTNEEGASDGEFYPHQLRIRAPDLAAEDRDPLVLTATAEVAVTVPTDLLEVL